MTILGIYVINHTSLHLNFNLGFISFWLKYIYLQRISNLLTLPKEQGIIVNSKITFSFPFNNQICTTRWQSKAIFYKNDVVDDLCWYKLLQNTSVKPILWICINDFFEIIMPASENHDIYFDSHQGIKTIAISKIPNIVVRLFQLRNTIKIGTDYIQINDLIRQT